MMLTEAIVRKPGAPGHVGAFASIRVGKLRHQSTALGQDTAVVEGAPFTYGPLDLAFNNAGVRAPGQTSPADLPPCPIASLASNWQRKSPAWLVFR
jgi:hypothetical protein